MEEKIVKVKIKGDRYLMNKFTFEQSRRKQRVYIPEEEAERKTNRNADKELVVPLRQVKASLVKASTDFKMEGKKTYKDYVRAGVLIEPEEAVLNPQEYKIHEEPVVIQRNRVISWRPLIENWSIDFTVRVLDEKIDLLQLREILVEAGKYKGIGDHRPEFGRFDIVNWEVQK